ncbi:MAG: ribonuclease R [Prevotella sp.]|nr:ribonuclease R [Prevotella sp.]MCM1075036.1 ribonuclease R [Ruminococcus sp.]
MNKGNRNKRMRKTELASRIVAFLQQQDKQAFNYKQIAFGIDAASPASRMDIINVLDELSAAGEIAEISLGRYKAKSVRGNESVGTFVRRSNGKNAVIIDDEPIMVAERNSMHALNGDKVRVVISAARKGQDPEAKVVEIVEEKDQVFIGTLKVDGNYAALVTDSKFLAADIILPKGKLKGGKDGDKAIARITKWNDDEMNPRGEIVDILGHKGDNTAEMHAILAEFGLPYKYPTNVEKAAAKIDAGITPEEVHQREDFRSVTTFTIDPRDAKDFDDALSVRRLANGNIEVGVHIADVTHYVRPGSLLDKEAQSRATSVYLVDRTVPMLPEHLSNGICSLRPNEEKLTFSAIFELDADANVVHSRIGRTVILSDRRFTYEEAQERIETGNGDFAKELETLNELAKKLRAKRFEDGAVDFDRAEVRFDIDETGKPIDVFFKVAKDSNKLVEEFMLLANRTVAEYIGKETVRRQGKKTSKAKAFVYRVHDQPDDEKLANLALIASRFGYKVKTDGSSRAVNKSINNLLRDIKGKGEENLLAMLAIRSMAKAVYTATNIGHYGLAFDYYTHFTSPIRRYPDMMVHRLLARYLAGGRTVDIQKLEDQCKHSSEMEQLAANAERASIKYKQVEYMQERIGEVYSGTISGVTEWGLYVELDDNMCEGLVPVRDLADDFYDYDEKNYCLTGRKHHTKYTLGDKVKVQVTRADLERKQLDFALMSDDGQPLRPRRAEQKATGTRGKKGAYRPSGGKHGTKRKNRKH